MRTSYGETKRCQTQRNRGRIGAHPRLPAVVLGLQLVGDLLDGLRRGEGRALIGVCGERRWGAGGGGGDGNWWGGAFLPKGKACTRRKRGWAVWEMIREEKES